MAFCLSGPLRLVPLVVGLMGARVPQVQEMMTGFVCTLEGPSEPTIAGSSETMVLSCRFPE